MRLHLRSCLTALCLAALSLAPAIAQEPGSQRLRVESIVVSGLENFTAREIVTSQTLLVIGREYSDEEIRHAVYRVRRLPFVLSADLTVQAGKEAGGVQVVIAVERVRAISLEADVVGTYNGDARDGQDKTDFGGDATLNGRWFVGSQGFVFASAQGFDGEGLELARIGYSRYGLFGRGASLTVSAGSRVDNDDPSIYDGALTLDVPLFGDHTLRTEGSWRRFKDDHDGASNRQDVRSAGLSWIYDTTDDPLFATRGTRWTAGGSYLDAESEFRSPEFNAKSNATAYTLQAAGRRHWALTDRQSISGELTGAYSRNRFADLEGESKDSAGTFRLAHAVDLRRHAGDSWLRDVRWENAVQLQATRTESFGDRETSEDVGLSTGLVLRSSWSLLRFTFTYLDNVHRDVRF